MNASLCSLAVSEDGTDKTNKVSVKVNSTATLKCSLDPLDRVTSVRWTHRDQGQGEEEIGQVTMTEGNRTDITLKDPARYVVNLQDSVLSLFIVESRMTDAGSYICNIEGASLEKNKTVQTSELLVYGRFTKNKIVKVYYILKLQ